MLPSLTLSPRPSRALVIVRLIRRRLVLRSLPRALRRLHQLRLRLRLALRLHRPPLEERGALGDRALKPVVSCLPFTTTTHLSSRDRFVLLASAGLWDVVDDAQAVQIAAELADGAAVEAVVIPSEDRPFSTLCVSSQVGCAQACTFCATGRMGRVRNLSTDEILALPALRRLGTPIGALPFFSFFAKTSGRFTCIDMFLKEREANIFPLRMEPTCAARADPAFELPLEAGKETSYPAQGWIVADRSKSYFRSCLLYTSDAADE